MVMFIKNNWKKIIFSATAFLIVGSSVYAFAINDSTSKQKSIDFLDKKVNIKLSTKEKAKSNILSIYTDDNNNEYIFKNEKIVGYFQNKKIDSKASLDNKAKANFDYREKADKFAQEIVDNNLTSFEKYQFAGQTYVESYDEINYLYVKTINGFITNDSINVALNTDGTLASISAPFQGIFDNLKVSKNYRDVEEYVNNYMEKNYNNLSYKIIDLIIDLDDNNNAAIRVCVEIEENGSFYTEEIFYTL